MPDMKAKALQQKYDNHKTAYEYYQNKLESMNMASREYDSIRKKCVKLSEKMDSIAELACDLGVELSLS